MTDQLRYVVHSSFADDTRLLKIIQSLMDTFKLQSDLSKIYRTKDNHMELNATKFEHLCYRKNDHLKSVSIYMCTIVPIIKKKKVNDLGGADGKQLLV